MYIDGSLGILAGSETNKKKTVPPSANHKRLDEEGQAMVQDLLKDRLRLARKFTSHVTMNYSDQICSISHKLVIFFDRKGNSRKE